MPDSISFLFPVFVIILICAVLWLIWHGRERYPYTARNLLTRREYKFYMILREAAQAHHCLVCPKVGVKDLLQVSDRHNYMKYFHKIAQKHVDFVICDEQLHVLFALELDDSSHETRDARERDRFKNKAFRAAGIPLKRISDIDENKIWDLFRGI